MVVFLEACRYGMLCFKATSRQLRIAGCVVKRSEDVIGEVMKKMYSYD